MRKVCIAFLRNCSPRSHSHASIVRRDPASILPFRALATGPSKYDCADIHDGEVGALSEISVGPSNTSKAVEKKAASLEKGMSACSEQDLRGAEGSLRAEISAVKAQTSAQTKIKSDAYPEDLGRIVSRKTATQLTDIGVVEAENVHVHGSMKADQNAAVGKTCVRANISAQEDLLEITAKLEVHTYKCGSRWEKAARKLLDYGIPGAHIIVMLQKCRNLSCSLHCVDSTLRNFALLGMSHQEMGITISRWPTILNTTDSMFQHKIEFYESIGIDKHTLGKTITARVKVIMTSLVYLRQNIAFWKDYMKDVHENAVSIMFLKNPQLLTYRLQKIQSKLAWLEAQDYNKKLLLNHSSILCKSLPLLISKAEVLESFGISDARKRVSILSFVCTLRIATILARFNNLLAAGFSHDQVQNILFKSPMVLCLTENKINSKLNYAVNFMNVSYDAIVLSPGFWSHRLETRIKYRYEVIKELQTLGALQRGVSLEYMICMTNADFNRRFVERFKDVVKHADAPNA